MGKLARNLRICGECGMHILLLVLQNTLINVLFANQEDLKQSLWIQKKNNFTT